MDDNNLQQVAEDYQPGDCLNEGTPIFILLSVQPRVRKKMRHHTWTKTENFQLLVEQTNLYYQQHVHRQARPSHRLPDITLHDMMTVTALAL
jgi:hypothetical protein